MNYLMNLILLVSIASFAQQSTYSIQGTIKSATSDYVYIKSENFIDSAKIKDGKFEFSGQFTQPKQISFSTKNTINSDGIYLENTNYQIDLEVDPDIKRMYLRHISGKSKTQQLKDDFISFYKSTYGQKDFEIKIYRKTDSIISLNPKNPLAGEILAALVEQGGILSSSQANDLLNKLDLKFQPQYYIHNIRENINKYERYKIGAVLPAISLPDQNDKWVDISKTNAKLTFVEFWNVGCKPCLEAIPKLKEVYKEFNSKNVEIVFVAVQEDKESWSNVLEEYDMPWQNLICLDEKNNQVIQSLQIDFYPSSFLIDENNQILALNLEPHHLRDKLNELLGETINE